MEESPEQVMARLARYADSLRRAPGAPIDTATRSAIRTTPRLRHLSPHPPHAGPPAVETIVWDRGAADLIPAGTPARPHPTQFDWRPTGSGIRMTLFGQLLAALACTLAVVAFEVFDVAVASAVVGATIVLGVIASAKRVPLAFWWTLGVVLGGVLGRFS